MGGKEEKRGAGWERKKKKGWVTQQEEKKNGVGRLGCYD
jgi:predicted transcriptional regulator